MTWSILARDPETGFYAMAIASRFFAAGRDLHVERRGARRCLQPGAAEPRARPPRARPASRGASRAASVVEMLAAMDRGIDQRQLHVIDATGATAAYTGPSCIDWCGHLAAPGVSVAGNMLAGRAGGRGDTGRVARQSRPADGRAPHRGDAGRRGRRRRQARQAVRRAAHPGPGGLSPPRPPRRRPRRAAGRAPAALRGRQGALHPVLGRHAAARPAVRHPGPRDHRADHRARHGQALVPRPGNPART